MVGNGSIAPSHMPLSWARGSALARLRPISALQPKIVWRHRRPSVPFRRFWL